MLTKIFSVVAGVTYGMIAGTAIASYYNSERLKADKELLDTIESYDFSNQEQDVIDAINDTKKIVENDIKDSKRTQVWSMMMVVNAFLVTWASKYAGTLSGPCMLLGLFIGNVLGSVVSANHSRAYQAILDIHTTLKGALNNER